MTFDRILFHAAVILYVVVSSGCIYSFPAQAQATLCCCVERFTDIDFSQTRPWFPKLKVVVFWKTLEHCRILPFLSYGVDTICRKSLHRQLPCPYLNAIVTHFGIPRYICLSYNFGQNLEDYLVLL